MTSPRCWCGMSTKDEAVAPPVRRRLVVMAGNEGRYRRRQLLGKGSLRCRGREADFGLDGHRREPLAGAFRGIPLLGYLGYQPCRGRDEVCTRRLVADVVRVRREGSECRRADHV